MKKTTLKLEENLSQPCFAVRSLLKGYRLAYFLNKETGSFFQKVVCPKQLKIYKLSAAQKPFEVFRWVDQKRDIRCLLIENRLTSLAQVPLKTSTLFEQELEHCFYWRDDCKKADFIIEFENDYIQEDASQLIDGLKRIPDTHFIKELYK